MKLEDKREISPEQWEAVFARVCMPSLTDETFFEPRGPTDVSSENKRSYDRFFLRSRAILKWNKSVVGVYTKDLSRQGIGFLSPVEFKLEESIQLQLTNGAEYHMAVTRCRRIGDNCFDCGARFIA